MAIGNNPNQQIELNRQNVEFFSIQHYNNPTCCSEVEFYEDYNRSKYLKKLFEVYFRRGILKERLILNHLIIFCNVFGIETGVRILYVKLEKKYWSILKTFLVYLHFHKDTVLDNNVDTARIPLDMVVANVLRHI